MKELTTVVIIGRRDISPHAPAVKLKTRKGAAGPRRGTYQLQLDFAKGEQ